MLSENRNISSKEISFAEQKAFLHIHSE